LEEFFHFRPSSRFLSKQTLVMTHGGERAIPSSRRSAIAAFLTYRSITRARLSRHADAFRNLLKLVEQHSNNMTVMAAAAREEQQPTERRSVLRAIGKWRGSTISGYLRDDEQTYLENFRCSKAKLEHTVSMLQGSALDRCAIRHESSTDWRSARRANFVLQKFDPPTCRYKVACCLYALGQGGPLKPLADACSLGKSTLLRYLAYFADAVVKFLKPLYMPCKPFGKSELDAVQGQFASRRGFTHTTLACDGSHIPFKPKGKKNQMEYRNFKGWTSILSVAFVDSYYRFFDLDVGYPGRAGDNTVLAHNWLMKAIAMDADKWLGPGGVILGDSGASDGDAYFLNPYHSPQDPEKLWFNFCHSSTRFFVEQCFGMWKSRFRFLLYGMPQVKHELFVKLIYASAILHNMLVVHSGDKIDYALDSRAWKTFFATFAKDRCPTCVREEKYHCIHQSHFRNGVAQQRQYRVAPSRLRDALCASLWQNVCDGPDKATITARMVDAQRARSEEAW
jgi:hypothetical protein